MSKTDTFKSIDDIVLDLEFNDIFELEYIQKLQTSFTDAFGISSLITDTKGNNITQTSNYCHLCKDIISKSQKGAHDCRHMELLLSRHHNEGAFLRECGNSGLWEAGVNINVGGKHIGNWILGQIQIDYKYDSQLKVYANNLGVNQEEFTVALFDVPIMTMERFKSITNMLYLFINGITDNAYKTLQLKKYIIDKEGLTD